MKLITESSDPAGLWRFLTLSTETPPPEVVVAAAARELQTQPRDVTAIRTQGAADRAAENVRASQRASLRDRVHGEPYTPDQLIADRAERGLTDVTRLRRIDGARRYLRDQRALAPTRVAERADLHGACLRALTVSS